MKLVTFGPDRDQNLIIQFPSIYPAIYVAAADNVLYRNSTSSHCRSE